jgi:paraquat-inducible protein B
MNLLRGGNIVKRIVFASILLLAFWGCKEDVLNIKIRYDQIQGLEKGNHVVFERNHIGNVKDIFYSAEGKYVVDVVINKAFANAASDNSEFFIIDDPKGNNKKAIEIVTTRGGGTTLENGSTLEGSTKSANDLDQIGDKIYEGLENVRKGVEEFIESLGGISESDEFKRLERELKDLAEQMTRTGKSVHDKIQKELLPKIKEEIEKLRKRLSELGRDEEVEPLETQVKKVMKRQI